MSYALAGFWSKANQSDVLGVVLLGVHQPTPVKHSARYVVEGKRSAAPENSIRDPEAGQRFSPSGSSIKMTRRARRQLATNFNPFVGRGAFGEFCGGQKRKRAERPVLT
ncbi:MAG TPA: hypothetical protein VGL01_04585 [Trinickia sp.]|uniref:hypothetical protein n=1 Tax=Trinickia sp. TaxID=2571163 RepID=UPI002F40BB3A